MTIKLSLKKKIIYSALVTCAFFVLLEIVLAIGGVTPVSDTRDPFVGFSSTFPLFEETTHDGTTMVETAENKLQWFNFQRFPKAKPLGTLRVFCLGGSTTYGRPHHDPVSFAGWLRSLLPVIASKQTFEVINAGGVSYASYRVAAVLEEIAPYDPDVLIVYSAQNEFLERRTYGELFEQSDRWLQVHSLLAQTRCWAVMDQLVGGRLAKTSTNGDRRYLLPAEVDEMLNHTVGPADYQRDLHWHYQVIQHYEFNLRRMVTLAKQMDAVLIFVTASSNLRDCSPFKSQNSANLDPLELAAFDELLFDAHQLIEQERPDQALVPLELAEAIDPHYALLHFEKGRALFALQRFSEARNAFQRALDEDVCPLRAVSAINATLRKVAAETNTAIVDYERQVRDRCLRKFGHECLGREHFLDHVHMTVDEHRKLALAILARFNDIGLIQQRDAFSSQAVEAVTQQVLRDIDRNEQGVALRNLAKVFHWAGKFSEALPLAERALTLMDGDIASMFVAGECQRLLGHLSKAAAYFERIIAIEPFHYDAHISLGMVLADEQELEDAALHLSVGVGGMPDSWYARQEYGIVLFQLAEYHQAIQQLERANELRPNNQRTLDFLTRATAKVKRDDYVGER